MVWPLLASSMHARRGIAVTADRRKDGKWECCCCCCSHHNDSWGRLGGAVLCLTLALRCPEGGGGGGGGGSR